MSDVGLTHVALPSVDLDDSIRFYQPFTDHTRPFVIVLFERDHVRIWAS